MNKIEKMKLIKDVVVKQRFSGISNLVKYFFDIKKRYPNVSASPISLQIELTSRCNLKCKMCEHSFKEINKKDLSYDQFVYIIDQFPFLKNITLQGLGEPLLNVDLFKMIREAKKRNIRIGLTTNGTLLTEEIGRKLIDNQIDWIFISLDSLNKDRYEEIRKGAKLDIVVANIEKFIKQKGNKPPETNFWTLIMNDNIEDIPSIVSFAKKLKMKKVVLQNIHNWGHDSFNTNWKKMKMDSEDKFAKMVENIKDIAQGINVEVNTNISKDNKSKCDWPWRSMYITSEGFVTPCCMQGSDADVINFGNIFTESVGDIINNDKYQNFRRCLNSDKIPKVCIGCPAYYVQKVIKI